MTPSWTITAAGTDLTPKLKDCLLSVTVTDKSGLEADELEVVIADPRAELAIPSLGVTLEVSLGYVETGQLAMGTFTADTIELANPPRVLTIRGASANLTGDLLTRKTKDWEDTTVAQVVGEIAGAHDLTAAVGAFVRDKPIKRLDQTNESDLSFLERLATIFDCIATIKDDGRVIFTPRGRGVSTSGTAIGAIALTQDQVTEWRIVTTERAVPTTVEARVYDVTQAKEEVVTASKPASLPAKAQQYAGAFATAEQKYGLPNGLLAAIAKTESSFNPNAGSPAGAQGLMQFMPATAARFGLTNPFDPIASIDAAGKYMQWLVNHYGGNLDNAIRAYNAGEGKVDQWLAGKTTLKPETVNYLPKVKAAQAEYSTGTGPTVRLRTTFQDPVLAQTAVESKVAAITRQAYTLTLTLPGRPTLAAETPLELSGFAPEVDGRWIITEASHHLDARGYVTALQAQRAAS